MSAEPLASREFHGAVLLNDFIPLPDGGNVRGVTGIVTVLAAVDALGFKTGTSESNWVARVTGPTVSVVIPGCKIHAIFNDERRRPKPPSNSDYWTVP